MTRDELSVRTQAFILAGGRGERLHPLTVARPKPAVSFGGMFRIIDFTLLNCLHSGLKRVSLLTQHQHEELHRYIRAGWIDFWDSTSAGRAPLMCLPPVAGKRYRGTADAVFSNAELLDDESEYALILSGDHVYQMDYGDLLKQHAEKNADLTIATVENPVREASSFGVVEVTETFRVTGFQEKPAKPRPMRSDPSMALVSMGVYVFKKTVLLDSLRALCGSGLGYDFGHDIIPALIQSSRIYAHNFRDQTQKVPHYWRDIGTIDAYYAASMDLVREDSPFDPYMNDHWASQATPHPILSSSAQTRNKQARLRSHPQAVRTVLSPGAEIEDGATVYESVLMPGVRVGKGAQLRRVIVEEGVQIPARFCAGFDLDSDRRQHTVTDTGVVVIAHAPSNTKRPVLPVSFNGARTRAVEIVRDADAIRATA